MSSAEQPPQPATIDKSSIDIETARSVTDELCQAIGDSDRSWAATAWLMDASGMPDREDDYATMDAYYREGAEAGKRLWRWLVAVAERSNELGEHDVAARAYLWVSNWIYYVHPTLDGGTYIALGFDAAPSGTHEALVREAQRALANLPDDFVVAETSEPTTLTVEAMARIVAEQAAAGGDLHPRTAVERSILKMEAARAGGRVAERGPGLPPDILEILERYGRWSFDPAGSGIDVAQIGHEQVQQPLIEAYARGPAAVEPVTEQVARNLLEITRPSGGWPVYGAYKLVEDIADDVQSPSKVALLEAALEFLRERGVPWNAYLSPKEMSFWIERHPGGAQEWLPWRDPPDRSDGPRELEDGEERHIATTDRPGEGAQNRIYARKGNGGPPEIVSIMIEEKAAQERARWSEADGGAEAIIRYPEGNDDFVWYTEPTIYDLFLRVGGALCTPPAWASDELARFIPQPPMNLD